MKTYKVLAPLLAVVAIAGCSHSAPAESTATIPTSESRYLDHLRSVGIVDQPGTNLVGAGREICRWLDEGKSGYDVLTILAASDIDTDIKASILASAVVELCPQYRYEF